MSFLELAKERYSVRKFSDKKIEKEKLDKILEAGHIAPTAKNIQPQRVYVLNSDEAIKKIEALSPCIYGAKTVLMVSYNADEEWVNSDDSSVRSGIEDASIVATHMMLEAKDIGIDSVWVNRFNNRVVEKEFNLPKNERLVLLLPIGYAAADATPSPMHTNKRPMEELVKYL